MNNVISYREKVLGAWLGKAAGGTLGQPWEGCTGPLELTYYDPVPTEMIANDDLDLQVVWACKLATEWGGEISRHRLSEAWPTCVNIPCDEYGVAIRNLRLGIPAPYTGIYDNWFTDGMGAAIRSEVWACLAPGNPELAAKYAYEDACVDHAGNGIYAEQFLAALESQAFVESDLTKIIETGLSVIPADSKLACAIRDTMDWCNGGDFSSVRRRIMEKYGSENFTDVKMNLSFVVAAMLLAKGDFVKTICHAVNFGMDADCTGATAGAIMGILNPDSIPEKWLAPIGRSLVLNPEITGINPPATLDGFTDLVVGLKDKVYLGSLEAPRPDLSRFEIEMRESVCRPWFALDYRKFKPHMNGNTRTTRAPGNKITVDFSEMQGESLKLLETNFRIDSARKVFVLVNTPAISMVWVDDKLVMAREGGSMVPAFHRTPANQRCELSLTEGSHTLRIGLAPATAEMRKAELVFGISETNSHWIPNAFYDVVTP